MVNTTDLQECLLKTCKHRQNENTQKSTFIYARHFQDTVNSVHIYTNLLSKTYQTAGSVMKETIEHTLFFIAKDGQI